MQEWDETPAKDMGEPDYDVLPCGCGHDELIEHIVAIGLRTLCQKCYEESRPRKPIEEDV